MKKRHIAYLNTQFMTACISTTLVLVLLGTIVLFGLSARNLSNYVRENINVTVLVNDDVDSLGVVKLRKSLNLQPYIKSVEYISKEDALKEETAAMGIDPSEFIGYNPYTASFEIKVKADYANNDSMPKIVKELKGDSRFVDVIYQKDLIKAVNENISKLSMILLIIAALFTYISFALINNTVRLTIFAKRFLINTMKLVGASWGFIRKPFLRNGLILGLLSAILADALLYGVIAWAMNFEPQLNNIINLEVIAIVALSVLAFGLLITLLCTYASLSRYLRMSTKDLYYI